MEKGKVVKVKKNSIYDSLPQKSSKRLAAWIVDIIMILLVATGIAFLTSLAYGYDNYNNTINEKYVEYGVKYEETPGSGNYIFCDYNEKECTDKINLLNKDKDYIYAYEKLLKGQILIISVAITGSLLIFEFIMPLVLKHGRTIGMRFFDVGYVTDEGIEPQFKNIFIRFLFGKLILEGLIPFISIMYIIQGSGYGLVGLIVLIIIVCANGYLLFIHKDKRGIHDYFARMRPVDNSNQIYINSTQELARLKAEESRSGK